MKHTVGDTNKVNVTAILVIRSIFMRLPSGICGTESRKDSLDHGRP
jgi:hypothetical protein